MQNKILITLCILCLDIFTSCAQGNTEVEKIEVEKSTEKQEPHSYGGWYCPDNLGGFPAVDIKDWNSVPVVNGRMATKEETQNGTSLIDVDLEKYPNAKPLDLKMPKLARYYNRSSRKEEIIIVIQALKISNDSIVGFRYLNGGNGSARLSEVKFLSNNEIDNMATSHFVTLSIDVNATKDEIWDILTNPKYYEILQPIFDKENSIGAGKMNSPKVNFNYNNAGTITSEFAGDLYGNKYIQIDAELGNNQYVEKFLVGENQETKKSEIVLVCGPYGDDFESQKSIINSWAQKVKELSEKQ
ncbi:MAG: hypothetical protein RID18_00220 [Cytophagales bacterium]